MQEALVVDMGDVQPDLVDVAHDSQPGSAGRTWDDRAGGAEAVAGDLGGKRGAPFAPRPRRLPLMARGASGAQKLSEGVGDHGGVAP